MTRLTLAWAPAAWDDYRCWQKADPATLKRINLLIEDCLRGDATQGIGKPEQLKFDLAGLWSRRINHEHRLVYSVTADSVVIVSARHHY